MLSVRSWLRASTRPNFTRRRCFSSNEKVLPSSSEIVIAGGGVVGTSIAYHLQALGWKDILLLEQGSVGCGTSWHAAGLVGSLRADKERTLLALYAQELFSKFEEEFGVGFRRCGGLLVAQTDDRALTYKNARLKAKEYGVSCDLVTPNEIKELNPWLRTDDIKMGIYLPRDGVVNPTDLVQAYLKTAKKNGATKLLEGVKVTAVRSMGKRVTSVETSEGEVQCDYFINAAGLWARELGLKSNPQVCVPLGACQHFYIVTKPMNVDVMMPVTRDHDAHVYTREWSGGIMAGGFEPKSLPCFYDGIPDKFEFQLLEENWDQFAHLMKGTLNRYPCMEKAEIRQFVNGPESFTPDGLPHVCRSKEFENYFILAGMSSNGIVNSAGLGKVISELLTYGESELWNPHRFDVKRMPFGSNNKYLAREAATSTLSSTYELAYPKTTFKTSRNVKTSPLHYALSDAGAVWTPEHNWEVPIYFKSSESVDNLIPSFGRPSWLENVQREIRNCNENIGLVDLTANSFFDVTYDDQYGLESFINSFDDVRQSTVGSSIETVVVGKDKECIAKVTLIKKSHNNVMLVTSAQSHNFLLSWLQESCSEVRMDIRDVTGNYAMLGLLGEKSEKLLKELISPTDEKLPEKQHFKVVDIGYACDVIIIGGMQEQTENSWRLLVQTQYSHGLYEKLLSNGNQYNILNVGHICLESLRVNNVVAGFPSEMSMKSDKNFVENVLTGSNLDTDTKMALLKVNLNDENNWPWEGEQVLNEGGRLIGHVTSVGYTLDDLTVNTIALLNDVRPHERLIVHVGDDKYHAHISTPESNF